MILNIFPEVITTNYIVSESIGILTLILVVIGYYSHLRKNLLLSQIITNCLITATYFFLGTYFACISVFIAIIRTTIFYIYETKGKTIPWWQVYLFCGLVLVNFIIMWSGIINILPLVAICIYTVAFKIKNDLLTKTLLLIANILFAVFNCLHYDYVGLIIKCLEIVTLTICIIKIHAKIHAEVSVINFQNSSADEHHHNKMVA